MADEKQEVTETKEASVPEEQTAQVQEAPAVKAPTKEPEATAEPEKAESAQPETPADEAKEEAPAEETAKEEAPAEETAKEEAPAKEAKAKKAVKAPKKEKAAKAKATKKDAAKKAPKKETAKNELTIPDGPVEEPEQPVLKAEEIDFNLPPLFGKYDFKEVVVHDKGLERYINISPVIMPHTDARHANRAFGKTKVSIVERLINNLMRTEKYTGKKSKSFKVVKEAFDIIAQKTKDQNPIQLLVTAVENSSPREEVTRLRYGGISVPKAVDIAPARRLDIAIRNLASGVVAATYKKKKSVANCLADEIIMASRGDMNSYAITKKEELERVSGSAR